MVVKVIYRAPSTKKFTVISEKGSKLIINRVFHKLLENEEEALNATNRQETGNFWMPSNNRTTTTVRFGGSAVLNIDYDNYELSESHLTAADIH